MYGLQPTTWVSMWLQSPGFSLVQPIAATICGENQQIQNGSFCPSLTLPILTPATLYLCLSIKGRGVTQDRYWNASHSPSLDKI